MEINNNEDEADNINRNLLNNNNNNNNNINNNNNNNNNNENNQAEILNRIRNRNNNQINEDEQGALFLSKYSIFSFSFIIIFLINIIFWILEKYEIIEQYKYVFEMEPITFHNQYYRFISRYFVHFGIGHLILELFISLFLIYLFENIYGSLFSLFFIIIAMFINSLIQLVLSLFAFYIIYYFNIATISSPYNYEGGFAPILFSLNTFLISFDNSYINENNFPTFVFFKSPYSSFYILVMIAFFTPNRSFIGNLSGILTAYFIRYFKISFLPKISWIISLENLLKLNGDFGTIYRNINSNNIIMKKILNQIEENCIRDNDNDKKEENDKSEKSNEINNINNDLINIEESHEQIEMSFINNQRRNN